MTLMLNCLPSKIDQLRTELNEILPPTTTQMFGRTVTRSRYNLTPEGDQIKFFTFEQLSQQQIDDIQTIAAAL